ncbi:acyl-CoA N-acyltransferase [Trametes maxima]|nr:acyl-CoA N-acyltransferase [Trametes maxima]
MGTSKRVRTANQASEDEIASVAQIYNKAVTLRDKSYSVHILHASSLSPGEKANIWQLWEANMRALVEPSSFGWEPKGKKKELFQRHARFILVFQGDQNSSDREDTAPPIAFCMFTFERDLGHDQIYCYELQVSQTFRGSGLGRFFIEKLVAIGRHWGMSKIVLTVLKSNMGARYFYNATGFDIDPSSPEYGRSGEVEDVDDNAPGDHEPTEGETFDYEILSKPLN